jgi:hypothetical protein
MKLGDAFTMAVPPNYDTPHLFFVISDPSKNGGTFVVVNITSDYIRAGRECVLTPHDHDWITKESYISFRDAMEIDVKKALSIDALMGTCVKKQTALRNGTLQRVVEAARASKGIPIKLKALL